MEHDSIAVVDFGGQYAHLISTKIRQLGVSSELRSPSDSVESFSKFRGIILSGSPSSVGSSAGEHILGIDKPVLGICYGHQFIIERMGGRVERRDAEYGPAILKTFKEHALLRGACASTVWTSHGDAVTSLPDGFSVIGETFIDGKANRFAAVANDEMKRYGVQFHPEVDDSDQGETILSNFVFSICKCAASRLPFGVVQDIVKGISSAAKGQVFILASGGIDSTVCAALAARAVGHSRVKLVHIDNGFMRYLESSQVALDFKQMGFEVEVVDVSQRFVSALFGVADPEEKRRIIGDTFSAVLEEQLSKLDDSTVAIQGTIYPDTIETGGTSGSDVIKTHHNRVPSMLRMIEQGRVLEPIRDLYKAEVREIAKEIGIPFKMRSRHPFPGPGLAIRCLCSDGKAEPLEDLSSFGNCAMLPVKSVGVKGDSRCYEHPAAVWGMTQRKAAELSNALCKLPGVNRCLLSLSGRVKSCELVQAGITWNRLELLRKVDVIVSDLLKKHGVEVWQCPVVLLPLRVNGIQHESVAIRPILSERGMTARPAEIPDDMARALCRQLLSMDNVSAVFLDVTTKPPATIEFE